MQQCIYICPTAVIFDKSAHPSDALCILVILLLGLLGPNDQTSEVALDIDMITTMTTDITTISTARPREEETTR